MRSLVTVAEVTSTMRGLAAEVPIDHELAGLDQESAINCDGCAKGLTARVNFISAQAEFTPPVIYSLEERARLVFRIEATPEQPEKLRVGQPVSVTLQPPLGVSHAQR